MEAVGSPPPPPVCIEAMREGHELSTELSGTVTPLELIALRMSLRHPLILDISSAIDDSGIMSSLDCVEQRGHAAELCGQRSD